MSQDPQPPAVNPLPPVVAALFLILMGIEAVFQLGARGILGGAQAVGWRAQSLQDFGFFVAVFDWMVQTGRWPIEHVIRFVSYPFVHASFTSALFAGVILLAMGKMVAEIFGSVATLLIFLVAAVVGALAFALIAGEDGILIGAFPPVYGLIGAFTYLLRNALAQVGANQARAFTLIAVLMGIQLFFGLIFGPQPEWIADLAGFAAGYGLSFFVAPGGWAKIRSRLRRD